MPIRICTHCNREFDIKNKDLNQGKGKFCSRACYKAFRKATEGTKNHPHWKGAECVCQGCGKVFLIKQSQLKKGYGKHCSMECRKLPKIELVCQLCGKSFYRLASQVAPENYGKFCSISCRQKHTCMTAFRRKPSSIEQLLIGELDAQGIVYEFQYPFTNCVLDFAFPAHKLAVEADGKYWHNLKHIKAKDKRKNKILKAAGWAILRFGEDEIRESPAACADKIIQFLDDHLQLHLF